MENASTPQTDDPGYDEDLGIIQSTSKIRTFGFRRMPKPNKFGFGCILFEQSKSNKKERSDFRQQLN